MADEQDPTLFDATTDAAPDTTTTDAQPIQEASTDGATPQIDPAAQTTTPTPTADAPASQPDYSARAEQHLEAIRRSLEANKTTTTATPPAETYTAEQLSNHKVIMLREMAKAQANGDEINAEKYARTVAWCDDKLMEQRLTNEKATWGRTQAVQSVASQMDALIAPHKHEFTVGTPLYTQANGVYQALLQGGYPDGPVTARMAAVMALQASGKTSQGLVQQTRSNVVSDIQKGLKAAVVAGAGGANQKASGPATSADIWSKSDAEFAAYEKQMRGN